MRRVFLGFAVLAMGVTNASAGGYCSLDPTLKVGLPIHTRVTADVSLLGTSVDLYVYNSSKTTTFGGGIGLP